MNLNSFLPALGIGLLVAAMSICRFENQRWVRARQQGMRGSSEITGAFVDLTGLVGLVFAVAFLVAYGFDNGWQPVVGLIVIAILTSTIYSLVSTALLGGDNFLLWMLGTVGIWLLLVPLASAVSWFGMF